MLHIYLDFCRKAWNSFYYELRTGPIYLSNSTGIYIYLSIYLTVLGYISICLSNSTGIYIYLSVYLTVLGYISIYLFI